jgi:hypothetical protein
MAPLKDFFARFHLGLAMENDLAGRWSEAEIRYRRALAMNLADPIARKLAEDGLESMIVRLKSALPPSRDTKDGLANPVRFASSGACPSIDTGDIDFVAESEPAEVSELFESLVQKAREFEASQRLDQAVACFRRAAVAIPGNPIALYGWRRLRQILYSAPIGEMVVEGAGLISFAWDGIARRIRLRERPAIGTALVCFQPELMLLDDDDDEFSMHTIYWEMRAICRLLLHHGFNVDAVGLRSRLPEPRPEYLVVLGLHNDIFRYRSSLGPSTRKIALLTGCSPDISNRREAGRRDRLLQRREGEYVLRRQIPYVEEELASYELADELLLIGNATTQATYADRLQNKMRPLLPTASWPTYVKPSELYVPDSREFLWMGGRGMVMKGLDLLLEIFAQQETWVLNVVGPVADEPDFETLYFDELYRRRNVRVYGLQRPGSATMRRILDRCFCLVVPSAAEGMSTSVLTCLQIGLYPIVSRENGVTLPPGHGIVLDDCEPESIRDAISRVYTMSSDTLRVQIETIQNEALLLYCRENYLRQMRSHVRRWAETRESNCASDG